MMKHTVLTILLAVFVVAPATPAVAQHTVFLVRHAERADSSPGHSPPMGADPDLSAAGRARAESLATVLKDAKIAAIYATEYKRTQQTAAPLAKALGLTVKILTSKGAGPVVKELKSITGNVLVVGHSNTVPEIINALGIPTPLIIDDQEYDNLFLVTTGSHASLLRLHYGVRP